MKPRKIYSSSSEEEDEQDNYVPRGNFQKSAGFHFKTANSPIPEEKHEELDVSREEEEDCEQLKPMRTAKDIRDIPMATSHLMLKNAVS
jgi:hypothetical protein